MAVMRALVFFYALEPSSEFWPYPVSNGENRHGFAIETLESYLF